MEESILKYWPVILCGVGVIIWQIRLESAVRYLETQFTGNFAELKLKLSKHIETNKAELDKLHNDVERQLEKCEKGEKNDRKEGENRVYDKLENLDDKLTNLIREMSELTGSVNTLVQTRRSVD